MKKTITRAFAVSGAALLSALLVSPSVSAQAPAAATTYQVNLTQQNRSGASGSATVSLNGSNVTVNLRATGLSPNLAHAAHIHSGGQAICPSPAADSDKDGFVNAKEADALVGPIKLSLTTSGDAAAASALAVDRMPKADAQGNLAAGVTAADMARASIDIHGVSSLFNDKTRYDGDKRSDLDSKLAFEITAGAACGRLSSAPAGGLATGFGSTAGIESPVMLAFGAAALAGAALLAFYSRRPMAGRN